MKIFLKHFYATRQNCVAGLCYFPPWCNVSDGHVFPCVIKRLCAGLLGRMEFKGWSLPNVTFTVLVSMTAETVSYCFPASYHSLDIEQKLYASE